MFCSTEVMEKALGCCSDITLSIHFYYLCMSDWLYFSIAAKFQPMYPVSETLCCNANVLELIQPH